LNANTFPHLAASYNGKIIELKTDVSSQMKLTGISQNYGQISGIFSALQLSETFDGFLDTSKHISFYAADSIDRAELSFTGTVQTDGELSGPFCAIDQNSNCIPNGIFGVWSVAPVK